MQAIRIEAVSRLFCKAIVNYGVRKLLILPVTCNFPGWCRLVSASRPCSDSRHEIPSLHRVLLRCRPLARPWLATRSRRRSRVASQHGPSFAPDGGLVSNGSRFPACERAPHDAREASADTKPARAGERNGEQCRREHHAQRQPPAGGRTSGSRKNGDRSFCPERYRRRGQCSEHALAARDSRRSFEGAGRPLAFARSQTPPARGQGDFAGGRGHQIRSGERHGLHGCRHHCRRAFG